MNVLTTPRMAIPAPRTLRGLVRWLPSVAACLALGLAVVFAIRRLVGDWRRELTGGELLLVTVALVGGAVAMRLVRQGPALGGSSLLRTTHLHAVATVASVLLAGAISTPGSPLWAVVFLWVSLSVEATWFWSSQLRGASGLAERAPSELQTTASEAPPRLTDSENLVETDFASVEEPFPPDRLQQISRFRDEMGAEAIHGVYRVELTAGQRVHYLHIPFCPPFDAAPELHFEPIDGPEATLSAGQVEPYGARIDLRLAQPADAGDTLAVEFYASCPAADHLDIGGRLDRG